MNSALDASSALAFLLDEPGGSEVVGFLEDGAAMSSANWAETLTKLAERGEDPDHVTERLIQQGILGVGLTIVPLDEAQARQIARLRMVTRATGLSLGDRACLALAQVLGVPAVTADRAWATLRPAGLPPVILIR